MKIILASASPRRRELMNLITANFTAVSADIDETIPKNVSPQGASEYLARLKAERVSQDHPDEIVIGCDTTVVLEGEIFGKPADRNECFRFLAKLAKKTHQVITGCCIIYKNKNVSFSEITNVTFKNLSISEIEAYISTGEPFDKAGGYGIQGKGALLAEKIEGDFFNIVGLPVSKLAEELRNFVNDIPECGKKLYSVFELENL